MTFTTLEMAVTKLLGRPCQVSLAPKKPRGLLQTKGHPMKNSGKLLGHHRITAQKIGHEETKVRIGKEKYSATKSGLAHEPQPYPQKTEYIQIQGAELGGENTEQNECAM